MFYDKFKYLCDLHGISCNKAALEMGLSNATPTKWKKKNATPDGATLQKVSDYFGVSINYLLGNEEAVSFPDEVSEAICSELTALFNEKTFLERHFVIPAEIKREIAAGSYRFNSINFPQFSDVLGKTLDDYLPNKSNVSNIERTISDEDLMAAFFDGAGDLTKEEMDEMWEDARDYVQYKLAQRRKKNNE